MPIKIEIRKNPKGNTSLHPTTSFESPLFLCVIMHCISQTGELQTNSALNLIVFGTKLEHLDLIEYVVVDLLNAKYNTFVRRVFRRQMIVFLLFFCLSSFCFISRPNQVRASFSSVQSGKSFFFSAVHSGKSLYFPPCNKVGSA